jgi:hypothetical protein
VEKSSLRGSLLPSLNFLSKLSSLAIAPLSV